MGQSFFQFKQFRVAQDRCAMKVCTDSCVMGAIIPVANAQRILDIGTGTGLLALMLAQRAAANVPIDALEIDEAATQQATENIAESPWKQQITIHLTALQKFVASASYDLIVSNPPFYENHLKRGGQAQNIAMHSEQLSLQELAENIARLLSADGRAVVLLPPYQAENLQQNMAQQSLFLVANTFLFDREGGKMIRHISTYARQQTNELLLEKLYIRNPNNEYTEAFIQLLKPYYLHL